MCALRAYVVKVSSCGGEVWLGRGKEDRESRLVGMKWK